MSSYPAVVLDHGGLQHVSGLYAVSAPGLEADGAARGVQGGAGGPHGRVQTVDGEVLRGLGAQEVEEVHLDASHAHLQLGAQNIDT